jgi:hypothetical protein
MDEKSDQILEQIETQRNRLGANLNELETRVRRTTDWHTHFDRNPMLMLGAALGGGILLGAMVSGARTRSGGSYTASRHFSSATAGSTATPARTTVTSAQRQRTSETIDHIKAALIAFATSKAKEFMNQALPGFDNYLREAESKGSPSAGEFRSQDTGYSAGNYGQTGGSESGNYGQQTSGSGQGANYGQNFGTDYGRPGGGQRSYSTERERTGSRSSDIRNS